MIQHSGCMASSSVQSLSLSLVQDARLFLPDSRERFPWNRPAENPRRRDERGGPVWPWRLSIFSIRAM